MNREPLALYLLRLGLTVGLFVWLGLLYWSSLLVEQDLKELQQQVTKLKREYATQPASTVRDAVAPAGTPSAPRQSQVDPALPNLLTEDPFYVKTLPGLLPPNFRPHGKRRTATISKPDNLHPFSNWSTVSDWIGQCTVAVGTTHFGRFETLAPDMALKMEERPIPGSDRTEFWIHLRDGVYWAPLEERMFHDNIELAPHFLQKHQVTADDYKFYVDAIMNPWVQSAGAVAMRNFLSDIEEIRVVDTLTFVVRWKMAEVLNADGQPAMKMKYTAKWITGGLRPLASFLYKYFADGTKIVEDDRASDTYLKNSSWAQNFNEHWAKNVIPSCGPWIFESMSDQQITFRRNPDYYQPLAVLVESMETYFKDSADSIWEDFKAGKIDSYALRPDQLIEWEDFQNSRHYQKQVAARNTVARLDYVSRSYSYIGWNAADPRFTNQIVRRALTQSIDRKRIIERDLNDLGIEITGPFFYTSKANDPSIEPWPFDPDDARHLLEDEGWADHRGTGVIDQVIDAETTPFTFTLTYFVKNPTARAISEYVSLALKDVNIDCHVNGVDVADLSAAFDDKSFEALLLGWTFGSPPEEPRQLWHSAGAKEKGSSNAVGFANAEADQIIDQLDYEYDPAKRIALYHRFGAIIHDECPYTFLFTPKQIFLYRTYLQNVWVPSERQDLIPGADMSEPQPNIFWIRE